MVRAIDAQEKQWQRESDAHTLAEAESIKSTPGRLKGAKTEAKNMAKKAALNAKSLNKVAKTKLLLKKQLLKKQLLREIRGLKRNNMSKLIRGKNKNGLDVLSKVSGISKKTMKEIWASVKANQKLLNSCFLHEFESHSDPSMSRRFKCKNCNGVIGTVEKNWYEKGIEHGKV